MQTESPTYEQLVAAARKLSKTIHTPENKRRHDLEVALNHNCRRKHNMLDAMDELYAYIHGKGEIPTMLPSVAFNPGETLERTNLYYIFKEIKQFDPWKLPRSVFTEQMALTFAVIENLEKNFPSKLSSKFKMQIDRFYNLLFLPRFHPEYSDAENMIAR